MSDPATGSTPAQILAQALLAHQQGSWQEALRLYQQVLLQDAHNPVALTNLASLYTRLQQYATALNLYQRRLQAGEVTAEVWFNYGNLQQKMGLQNDAVSSFQTALRLQANLYPAHYNLGNLLRDLGHYDQAIQHYKAALALQPQLPLAQRNLGNLYRQLGQFALAIQHHRLALALPQQNSQQHGENCYNLANALASAEQFAEAVHYYQQATRLLADPVEAWINLGNLQQRAQDAVAAERCYRSALQQRRDHP
ncbi:tetratricopeptide repeat protein, partial [Candidatus Magnetaquicoccus inordinatus]|uniref:tetratricopeptide repeat protein n=1 Tax=Candidatus Magnetaquicoccus inordinatus TaxID=2496818 RepID=UPI00102BA43D